MKKIAVLGYGGRGFIYTFLCKRLKKDFEIVAVIDSNPEKLRAAAKFTGLGSDRLYSDFDRFLADPKVADWLFVCTQDKDHKNHSIKAMEKGYHLLLEKPVATTPEDCIAIAESARANGVTVAVCHVLRYSVYYQTIKKIMDSGVLGKIISIEQIENVGYWHQAHSFVRGDWRDASTSTPMILAKCCHDLDIAVYLADSPCRVVSSQGALHYFRPENAPEGSTARCLDGCKAKANCPYDCEKIYIDPIRNKPGFLYRRQWPQTRLASDGVATLAKVREALQTSTFGRCVFRMDNNVVDYQATTMEFENGIRSTLIMTAFSDEIYRETRIRGTDAELVCDMRKPFLELRRFGKKTKKIRLPRLDAHGGGDPAMIRSLADDSIRTDIFRSIESHLIAFAAEASRLKDGAPVEPAAFRQTPARQ